MKIKLTIKIAAVVVAAEVVYKAKLRTYVRGAIGWEPHEDTH